MSKNGQAPTLALDELNELEALAYSAEAEPSEIRWQQAQLVAELNDEGISTRAIAAGWINAETGEAYSHTHVRYSARAWRAFGNYSLQDRPRFYTAYNSDEVRKPKRAETGDAPPLPPGTYGVIYADPPWRFDNSGFAQSAASHYPTMTVDEIADLHDEEGRSVTDLVASSTVLYLWATASMLPEALQVMEAWGFEYKTHRIWRKPSSPGMGFWLDTRHELLLIGAAGSGSLPSEKMPSVVDAPIGRHSRKPDVFRQEIEAVHTGPYIELFAREAAPGWDSWGNENV